MTPLLLFALPTLDGAYKILVYLVMLSVLVVLHEYGHFLLARRNGVRVNDFAVGFGPTLVKWTSPRSGTNYRINLLPIGGYCAMQGEDGKTSEAEQQRAYRSAGSTIVGSDNFQAKSPLARLAIVVAGPAANFLVTFLLLFFVAVRFGVPDDRVSPVVGPLMKGYPAERAGIRPGDVIRAIDGKPVTSGDALVDRIHASVGKPLHITFEDRGVTKTVTVTPVNGTSAGKKVGLIGFRPIPATKRVNPIVATQMAFDEFGSLFSQTVASLVGLIVHPATAGGQVQGVIGLAAISAQAQDFGWGIYLQLAAAISLSLGLLNLFPFPALDGGRAAFIIAEMLRGKPVDPEKEALVHVGGFAALMALMLFVAYHDIANLVTGKAVF